MLWADGRYEAAMKKQADYMQQYAALVPSHWTEARREAVITNRRAMLPSLSGTMHFTPSVASRLRSLRKRSGRVGLSNREVELTAEATALADEYVIQICHKAPRLAMKRAKERGLSGDEAMTFAKSFVRRLEARREGLSPQ